MIELRESAKTFEALGHEVRLAILRQLIPAGPNGVHAGAIGAAVGVSATRLSFHLNRLTTAGLIENRREGRHLYYAVRYPALGALVGFLVNDCCAAAPSGCLPDCPATVPIGCAPTCTPGAPATTRAHRAHEEGG